MARSMAASTPLTHEGAPVVQGPTSQRRDPLQPKRGSLVSPTLPVLPTSNVPQLHSSQRQQQGKTEGQLDVEKGHVQFHDAAA